MQAAAGAVGRIVAASLNEISVECFRLDGAPPLGALVAVAEGGPALYAVVSSVITEGIDPSRPVAPHGGAEEDLDTVLNRNPHLPVLLRTSFSAVIAGHEQDGQIRYYLPDTPPRLISRVRLCDTAEQSRFAGGLDVLEPLLASGALADDVVAAFLRRVSLIQPDRRAFLLEAGRALVPLLVTAPDRLIAIIRRIEPEPAEQRGDRE